jgi:LuxR family maltose regulon positive regulatory protein
LILATGYLIELRLLGRLEESVAFSDRVSARVNALAATEPDNKGRLAWFYLHRGLTFSLSSDSVRALRAYRLSWEYATGSAVDFVRSQAAANMALTYALAGDAPQAEEWLARHRGFDTARWPGNFVVSIGGHLAAGLLALDRLDLDEVRAELSHLGDGSAALELWPFIAYLYAQHALHTGRAPEALAHLDRVQASNDEGSPADKAAARTLISRARIDLLVACGRGERAKRLIQTAGARRFSIRVPALRLRLLSGLDVIPELDPLTWDAATPVRDRVEMLLLGAVATLRQDDQRNARHFMHQALDLYSETGILRPFATIAVAEVEKLLELTGREMAPGDMAALARQPSVYPARLVFVELSEHEQAVLEALAATGSRQAIADSLFVSVNTVKTPLASIYHKLGSSSREEALARATEHELLQRASGAE